MNLFCNYLKVILSDGYFGDLHIAFNYSFIKGLPLPKRAWWIVGFRKGYNPMLIDNLAKLNEMNK